MKKVLPYILIAVIAGAVIALFFTGQKSGKQFDDRLSFRKRDKIPYGMYVAYEGLKSLFPGALVTSERQEPGYWDSLSTFDDKQALLIITPQFNASESEMKKLRSFMQNGNNVFISTMQLSSAAADFLGCRINYHGGMQRLIGLGVESDSLKLTITVPLNTQDSNYAYPGAALDFYFYRIDTSITTVLGHSETGKPNFVHFKTGKGNLYLQVAPMAFSNYFLLHKNNMGYYEQALSVLPAATRKIVWDEYYLYKRAESTSEPTNWLDAFLKHPGLKWALLTALLALLLYVLQEMRRKQRYIPVIAKPKNDSMEFVKTIGRLYHDKGDHKNLSRKMAAYFLEHVRSRYKMQTSLLNDEFIEQLRYKTGVDELSIREIVIFIKTIEGQSIVSDQQLALFHKQLELFYKKA